MKTLSMTNRNALFAGIAAVALLSMNPAAFAQAEAPAAAPPLAQAPAAGTTPSAPQPYTPPSVAPDAPIPPADGAAVSPPAAEAPPPASNGAATAAKDDAALAAATGLTTMIEDVQVVGPWMDGDKSGIWRTVMMQVGTADKEVYRFFIQQIEKEGAVQTILATTEIKEIPGIDGAIVGYRADEPTEGESNSLTLFFDIVPSDGEIAETYELHFTKDQPYVFGPASN